MKKNIKTNKFTQMNLAMIALDYLLKVWNAIILPSKPPRWGFKNPLQNTPL